MADYDNEYMFTVEKLFWDWYHGTFVELYTKEQRHDLNNEAEKYAKILKLDFPRDPRHWDEMVDRDKE